MKLKTRIEKLEEQVRPEGEEKVTFVLLYGDRNNPAEIKEIQSDILWRPKK
jgi:hypothetical protein